MILRYGKRELRNALDRAFPKSFPDPISGPRFYGLDVDFPGLMPTPKGPRENHSCPNLNNFDGWPFPRSTTTPVTGDPPIILTWDGKVNEVEIDRVVKRTSCVTWFALLAGEVVLSIKGN